MDRLLYPDPATVGDVAGFVHQLRLLRIWAGNPSFPQLQKLSGVPRSTLSDAISPRRTTLPSLPVVRALVTACGESDVDAVRWVNAWRRIAARHLRV